MVRAGLTPRGSGSRIDTYEGNLHRFVWRLEDMSAAARGMGEDGPVGDEAPDDGGGGTDPKDKDGVVEFKCHDKEGNEIACYEATANVAPDPPMGPNRVPGTVIVEVPSDVPGGGTTLPNGGDDLPPTDFGPGGEFTVAGSKDVATASPAESCLSQFPWFVWTRDLVYQGAIHGSVVHDMDWAVPKGFVKTDWILSRDDEYKSRLGTFAGGQVYQKQCRGNWVQYLTIAPSTGEQSVFSYDEDCKSDEGRAKTCRDPKVGP